jgi:hypothetical protein
MKKEQDLKRLPYGVSDFDDFRKRNLYYVDKTRYIRDIEEKGKYLLFIRPRRFKTGSITFSAEPISTGNLPKKETVTWFLS